MFKVLGITDAVTTCDCCGRSGLKRTVALDSDGVQVHYGTDCAAQAVGTKRDRITDMAKAADYARKWIATHPAAAIANAIRVRWCNAHADGNVVVIGALRIS